MKSKKSAYVNKWQAVELSGDMFTGSENFEGFAGLEILENYDDTFLNPEDKTKKYLPNELQGDIYDGRKRKNDDSDDDDEDSDDNDKKSKKKQKKKKTADTKKETATTDDIDTSNTPGKYVLMNKDVTPDEPAAENPNSDAIRASWTSVGVISEEILQALVEMNFKSPTEIQRLTLPTSVFGKVDILGAAETGSGKTLAFGIPIIQNIQKLIAKDPTDEDNLYALILTPTRELAQQVMNHLKNISKYTNVTIAAVIGGLATVKQERVLKKNPHVVVATPGRLWELIQEGNVHLNKIDSIRYLVTDETDRMMEKGHFEELQHLLLRINTDEQLKNRRQNFVFSATLTMVHELPDYLQKRSKKSKAPKQTREQKIKNFIGVFGMSNPKIVDVTKEAGTAEKLTESRILCPLDEKDFYLYYVLIKYPGRTIIFCNSIECVKRLTSLFSYLDVSPPALHGNMEQKQRLKNLEKFEKNPQGVLIATDVAARGLDIPNVNHVVHYQVPTTAENYVHRSGRTARANEEGLAILLMDPTEVKFYIKLQKTLKRNEDLPIFPTDSTTMSAVRERVRLARDVEILDLKIRRINDHRNWEQKAAEDIGIMIEDSEDSDDGSKINNSLKKLNLSLKHKKQDLSKALNKTIIPGGFKSLKFPINPESLSGTMDHNVNPIEAVKNIAAKNRDNKMFKMKLYRSVKGN